MCVPVVCCLVLLFLSLFYQFIFSYLVDWLVFGKELQDIIIIVDFLKSFFACAMCNRKVVTISLIYP